MSRSEDRSNSKSNASVSAGQEADVSSSPHSELHVSGIRTDLPQIIVSRMTKIPFQLEPPNLHYHYFSHAQVLKSLSQVLSSLSINIGTDALELIASYCHILSWDSVSKGRNIKCNILSDDNQINYAILHDANWDGDRNNDKGFDTIYLNEWIGDPDELPPNSFNNPNKSNTSQSTSDSPTTPNTTSPANSPDTANKAGVGRSLVYRYVFKWFGGSPSISNRLEIGLISLGYNVPVDGPHNAGIANYGDTVAWDNGATSTFACNGVTIGSSMNTTLGAGGSLPSLPAGAHEDNMYFVLEVRVNSNAPNVISFYGAPTQHIKDVSIRLKGALKGPFKVAVSLSSGTDANVGLGLVLVPQEAYKKLGHRRIDKIEVSGLRTWLPLRIANGVRRVPSYAEGLPWRWHAYEKNGLQRALSDVLNDLCACNGDKISSKTAGTVVSGVMSYCGMLDWNVGDSAACAAHDLDFVVSEDQRVSYAILRNSNKHDAGVRCVQRSVFLNEWFGGDAVQWGIVRLVFKWFGAEPEGACNEVAIGIDTNPDDTKNCNKNNLKIGDYDGSVAWQYGGNVANTGYSVIRRDGKLVETLDSSEFSFGFGGTKRELSLCEFEPNMYVMCEIDFIRKCVSFHGPSVSNNVPYQRCAFSIASLETPFRIGVTLTTSSPSGVGVGVVRLQANDLAPLHSLDLLQNDVISNEIKLSGLATRVPHDIARRFGKMLAPRCDPKVGFNYYSLDQMLQALQSTPLVRKFKKSVSGDDMIWCLCIITYYAGLAAWDKFDKSRSIEIARSSDTKISYALLSRPNFITNPAGDEVAYYEADTVVLNEWIGCEQTEMSEMSEMSGMSGMSDVYDKKVFRYYFKWFGNEPDILNLIKLGVVTSKFSSALDQGVSAAGSCGHSAVWRYAEVSHFQYNGFSPLLQTILDSSVVGRNYGEHRNNYFMLEVNFEHNFIGVTGPGIQGDYFKFSIAHLVHERPFRVALSLYSSCARTVGLGLVALAPEDLQVSDLVNIDANEDLDLSRLFPFELSELKTDHVKTGLRTKLPLNVQHAVRTSRDAGCCYNYYSYDALEQDLRQCGLVRNVLGEHDELEEIVLMICEFRGTTTWRRTEDAGKYVAIGDSDDGKISYAVSTRATNDTIFMNEWMGASEDETVFRYVFKWYGNGPRSNNNNNILLGVVTESYSGEKMIGCCGESMAWYYKYHDESYMIHDNRIVNAIPLVDISLGRGGVKKELQRKENEDDMYFVVEIDLVDDFVRFYGKPFRYMHDTGFSVRNVQKPLRLGLSLSTGAENSIGLGIVKVHKV